MILDVSWVFRPIKDGSQGEDKETACFMMLFKILQGMKNDNIFDLDFVKFLIESSWEEH